MRRVIVLCVALGCASPSRGPHATKDTVSAPADKDTPASTPEAVVPDPDTGNICTPLDKFCHGQDLLLCQGDGIAVAVVQTCPPDRACEAQLGCVPRTGSAEVSSDLGGSTCTGSDVATVKAMLDDGSPDVTAIAPCQAGPATLQGVSTGVTHTITVEGFGAGSGEPSYRGVSEEFTVEAGETTIVPRVELLAVGCPYKNSVTNPTGKLHGEPCTNEAECKYGICMHSDAYAAEPSIKFCTKQCQCGVSSKCGDDKGSGGEVYTCQKLTASKHPTEKLLAFCTLACMSISDCPAPYDECSAIPNAAPSKVCRMKSASY